MQPIRSHTFDLTSFPEDIAGVIIGFLPLDVCRFALGELQKSKSGQLHPLFHVLLVETYHHLFLFQGGEPCISADELRQLSTLYPAKQCPLNLRFKFDSYNDDEAAQLVQLLQDDPFLHTMRNLEVEVERDDFFQNGVYNFCQAAPVLAPCISKLTLDLSSATRKLLVAHILKWLPEFHNLKSFLLVYMGSNEELPQIEIPDSVEELLVKTSEPGLLRWPENLKSLTYYQNLKCMDLSRFASLKSVRFYQTCNTDSAPCILPAGLKTLSLVNTTSKSIERMRICNLYNLTSLTLSQLPTLHQLTDLGLSDSLQSLTIEDCPIGVSPQNLASLPLELKELALKNTHLHIGTLQNLKMPFLEKLTIFEPQLASIPDLTTLNQLQSLIVESCGITNLDASVLPAVLTNVHVSSNEKFSMETGELPDTILSLSLVNAILSGERFPPLLDSLHLSYSESPTLELPEDLREVELLRCLVNHECITQYSKGSTPCWSC